MQTVKQELEYQQNELREDLTIDLWDLGIKLTKACEEFFDEYIPHMKEEEQVSETSLSEILMLNAKYTVCSIQHWRTLITNIFRPF